MGWKVHIGGWVVSLVVETPASQMTAWVGFLVLAIDSSWLSNAAPRKSGDGSSDLGPCYPISMSPGLLALWAPRANQQIGDASVVLSGGEKRKTATHTERPTWGSRLLTDPQLRLRPFGEWTRKQKISFSFSLPVFQIKEKQGSSEPTLLRFPFIMWIETSYLCHPSVFFYQGQTGQDSNSSVSIRFVHTLRWVLAVILFYFFFLKLCLKDSTFIKFSFSLKGSPPDCCSRFLS